MSSESKKHRYFKITGPCRPDMLFSLPLKTWQIEDIDLLPLGKERFNLIATAALCQLKESNPDNLQRYRHGCEAIEPGFVGALAFIRTSQQ